MYSVRQLLRNKRIYSNRINVDVTIVRETFKAYLISFDGKQKWLPKSWILGYKNLQGGETRITISDANWVKKFE
jgi:hypothetical protein